MPSQGFPSDQHASEDEHESVGLSEVGSALRTLADEPEDRVRSEELIRLRSSVAETDLVMAAVAECPEALKVLAQAGPRVELAQRPVQHVLLTTKTITTGGVSMVLLSQARHLLGAGYRVTIVGKGPGSSHDLLPEGAEFVEMEGGDLPARVGEWREICASRSVDVIIDHQTLYTKEWPAYALMARALGIPTIGWVHNFAGRPLYDLSNLTSFLTDHLDSLAKVVTLSPLDAVYWKLRGVPHAVYLPNPASPMIHDSSDVDIVKASPAGRRLELIWWGRLDEHTKQVRELIAVAAELKKLEVDFRLRVIGPEWKDLTPAKFKGEVRQRGLENYVDVVGPLHGQELIDAVDAADVFVSTSVIEGYQLTILEAQARGLPVVMYEMPWLLPVQGNRGIVSVPQADSSAFARAVAALHGSPERFSELSAASLEAARRIREFDFAEAYQQLIEDTLPETFSPEPTLEDAQELIDLLLFYVERHSGLRTRGARKRKGAAASQDVHSSPGRPLPRRVLAGVARRARPYARLALSYAPALKPAAHRLNYELKRRIPR
ncbi:glycosyltransferase family 4 protein [Nesterenkonia flava]|uniref:Glycosyltransferase n=1 Tax=Nesterenkonia flava TaxID=469799 RepID=A0ABU1FSP6_9MICC|nr:glycosyltransferase [Nesterenkonia flava]MDR5711688.1 glycosyltransferase [Nesterenkonia flava]